jgi:FtsZ-interacting cell division protein ZipA
VDTWLIVVIVVVAIVVLLLVGLALSRRSRVTQARKREQAREHLQEAQVRGAQAAKEQALAEEQAARARRERAEVEERAALAEQDARERAARAEEEQAAAAELRARAEKLAPDLADGESTQRLDHPGEAGPTQPDGTPYPDQPGGGGATRR